MRTELEEFEYPKRKPWLILIVLAVIGAAVFLKYRDPGEKAVEAPISPEAAEGAVESSAEPVSDGLEGTSEIPSEIVSDLNQIEKLVQSGDLVKGRAAYLQALETNLNGSTRRAIEKRLGKVNCELFLEPYPLPEKEEYVVKRGDSLERIARRMGTTIDLLQQSNRLANRNVIKIGDRLRVLTGTFSIEVSKEKRELVLSLNGKFFKKYGVGIGKFDKTPAGTFVITDKEKEPVWWPQGREVPFGDPDNVLGTRWMAIKATGDTPPVRGYGIHGTWEDDSIGKAESAGCVRLVNADVEELYTFVPSGTPVIISK